MFFHFFTGKVVLFKAVMYIYICIQLYRFKQDGSYFDQKGVSADFAGRVAWNSDGNSDGMRERERIEISVDVPASSGRVVKKHVFFDFFDSPCKFESAGGS